MTVRFSLDTEDIMAFQSYFLANSKMFRKTIRSIRFMPPALFIILAFVLTVGMKDKEGLQIFVWVYMIVTSVLWVILMPGIMKKVTLKKTKKALLKPANVLLFEEREITFSEEGVVIRTDKVDENLKWDVFIGVAEVPKYFFLFISAQQAHVIPALKFTEQQNTTLREMFMRHINKPVLEV